MSRDTRGAAILELTIILPILLAIGLGVFEFGNLLYRYHLIYSGVRDAARYAAGVQQGTKDTEAKNIAVYGVTSPGSPEVNYRRISWWAPASVSVTYQLEPNGPTSCGSAKCYRGGDNIVRVTVSTSVNYTSLGFLSYLGLGPITLTASHQERHYGVR